MDLTFWNVDQTKLCNKIAKFSSSMSWKKLENFYMSSEVKKKYKDKLEYLEQYADDINKNYWWDMGAKKKLIQKESKDLLNEFLSDHIIPSLLSNWYFDTYEPKKKKDAIGRDMVEWRQW